LKANHIIFPAVEFQGATLEEAVEYFRVKSRLHDPQKAGAEVFIKSGHADKPAITVSLSHLPMPEALNYCAELAGFALRVEGQNFSLSPAAGD
jgi:general secretion pathway protein D